MHHQHPNGHRWKFGDRLHCGCHGIVHLRVSDRRAPLHIVLHRVPGIGWVDNAASHQLIMNTALSVGHVPLTYFGYPWTVTNYNKKLIHSGDQEAGRSLRIATIVNHMYVHVLQ